MISCSNFSRRQGLLTYIREIPGSILDGANGYSGENFSPDFSKRIPGQYFVTGHGRLLLNTRLINIHGHLQISPGTPSAIGKESWKKTR